jgi:hypothetical protein
MIETTLHTERQTLPLTILFEKNLKETLKIYVLHYCNNICRANGHMLQSPNS